MENVPLLCKLRKDSIAFHKNNKTILKLVSYDRHI